jgi:rhodanese-related sulfurtransferase
MKQGRSLITARDGMTIGGLMLLSLALGLAVNRFRAHSLPFPYAGRPVQVEASDLDLKQFEAIVRGGEGIVIDARPELFHRMGHVPGALSLPREDFDAALARLRHRLEPFRAGPIVVYCSDEFCDDSRLVQGRLLALGYERVSVFPGGWEEWSGAGLPEEGLRR